MLDFDCKDWKCEAKGLKTKIFPGEQLIKLALELVFSWKMKVKKLEIVEACVSAKADYQFCEVTLADNICVLIQLVTDDLFTFVIDKIEKDGSLTRNIGLSSISLFDLDGLDFLPFKKRTVK